MMDNFIQIGKSDVLTLKIRTENGEETGEALTFDLEDITLALRLQELVEKDKKNREWLRNQMLIIDKKQDVKGKKLLSKNDEDRMKALNDFFTKEIEIYNIFLGENGVQKLLNGRKPNWTMFEEIDNIIEKQIIPHLDLKMESISEKIKKKYGSVEEKEILK